MTTLILDDYISAKMDALMTTGNFASREEMVLQGLSLLEELQEEEYPPEVLAAIDEGIDSADAGDLIPIEVVAEHLRQHRAARMATAAE